METADYFKSLLRLQEGNASLWQAIIVHTDGSSPARCGMKMLIPLRDAPVGNLGGGEMEHHIINFVREKQPDQALNLSFNLGKLGADLVISTQMICGGSATVYIEPLHRSHEIFIIGAGHCGKELGRLAKACGFWVHLVDNRQDILDTALEDTFDQTHFSDYRDLASDLSISSDSWLVIMTHGHLHDKQVLQQCLKTPCRYLGMIGSKNKVAETFAALVEQGHSPEALSRVHAPIGICIGSQSPIEIAISIMAEIIREYRLKPV